MSGALIYCSPIFWNALYMLSLHSEYACSLHIWYAPWVYWIWIAPGL